MHLIWLQFEDIGLHGTKVIVYNLWFNDDGNVELDFDTDPEVETSFCLFMLAFSFNSLLHVDNLSLGQTFSKGCLCLISKSFSFPSSRGNTNLCYMPLSFSIRCFLVEWGCRIFVLMGI